LLSFVLLLSYFLSVLFFIFLPHEKPNGKLISLKETTHEDKKLNFDGVFTTKFEPPLLTQIIQKARITKPIEEAKPEIKIPEPIVIPEVLVELKEEPSVASTLTLMAIFDMGKGKGFITLIEKGARESFILSVGEEFRGLKLTKVFPLYAMFKQNDIEYKIELNNNKLTEYRPEKPAQIITETKEPKLIQHNQTSQIKATNNKIEVDKNLLETYTKDTDKIWRDISIKEHLTNDKIDGFRVDKVKKDSNFEKLGIRSGDIFKTVNGVDLKSYDDAMNVFKKMGKISSLNMKIKRGNELMELNYDIK